MADRSPLDPDPLSEVPLDAGERAELLEKLADHARPLIAQLSEEQRGAAQELWERLRTQTTVASFEREAAAFLDALEDPKRFLTRPEDHSSQAELRPSKDDSGALNPQAVTPVKEEGQSFSEETARVEPSGGGDGTSGNWLIWTAIGTLVAVIGGAAIYFGAIRGSEFDCLPNCDGESFNRSAVWAGAYSYDNASYVGADFRNADLYVDFGGSDFRRADLRRANLTEASMRSTDLRGARIGGADIGGVKWAGATCPNGRKVPRDIPRCGP